MTDDLVKRLREPWFTNGCERYQLEAADRIEALTADRENRLADLRIIKAERDRLREALRGLERASTEVASYGARTGTQWLKLTVANLNARAALKGETP